MNHLHQLLLDYWGYSSFRDKQVEIITRVLDGKDTLALLPTGGGKSICYQIPGMAQEGVCLVVSPLIALMTDQVQQLKKRGIPAVAISAGMSKKEIDIALDNAIYGKTKFLYVSPERLKTHLFKVRLQRMHVNLIAVDEAHCISEWGYDFRPAYLTIAELRVLKPLVPILALTATATADVVVDIQEKLLFQTKHVIKKSFERKNLTYNTVLTVNKKNEIERFLSQNKGCGIIYCATRRTVKTLCAYLLEKGFTVDYYHGGLDFETRQEKQKGWTNGTVDIMVSTNAFGMGIDKPDVRFVLHYDIPESLEAYYQEAGRGGRDGGEAQAFLFYEEKDLEQLKDKIERKYPPLETIKKIYNALGNHFQLAIGSGKGEQFPIDLVAFSEKYKQTLLTVYHAIKFLELCAYIKLSDDYKVPSRLKVTASNFDLYQQQTKDTATNKIIQFILRTEIGAFEDHVHINEFRIAKKIGLPVNLVIEKLLYLKQLDLVDYIQKSDLPTVTYLTERLTDNNISISPQFYQQRKVVALKKHDAVTHFLETEACKSETLLHYFGEEETTPCQKCVSCFNHQSFNEKKLQQEIIELLSQSSNFKLHLNELTTHFSNYEQAKVIQLLREMSDLKKLKYDILKKEINLIS